MIEKLTPEQEQRLQQHRDEWFRIATSTELADRRSAEVAARELAELGGVKVQRVVWVTTPEAGAGECRASFDVALRASLRASLSDSLSDSLRVSLRVSLWASLWASLSDSLRASLSDSLWASLSDSLGDSLSNSLWDSPWVAWYLFGAELGVQYDADSYRKLELTAQLLRSCFACWIGLGVVVLCERPATVEIQDGKLVGLTWRCSK